MGSRKTTYILSYKRARDESEIAWHHEEIPVLLEKAVERLGGRGRALDLGCGTGVHAVYMAEQGMEVTAIDFIPGALEFAGKRAESAGVHINFIQADVTKWVNSQRFDLILDSGCLHNLSGKNRRQYKEKVPGWMSDQASLVLVHFGKRSLFDFNRVGLKVKRKTRDKIEGFFLPELELKDFFAPEGERPLFQYLFTWKNRQ